jgi:hypothetical protein
VTTTVSLTAPAGKSRLSRPLVVVMIPPMGEISNTSSGTGGTVPVGVAVAVMISVGVTLGLGVAVGVTSLVGDAVAVGSAVSVSTPVGSRIGMSVRRAVGSSVAVWVGPAGVPVATAGAGNTSGDEGASGGLASASATPLTVGARSVTIRLKCRTR